MEKLDPEVAMDMTVAQIARHLKWATQRTNYFLKEWRCLEGEEWPKPETLTLRIFLNNVEERGGENVGHQHRRRGYRRQSLVVCLREIGITRLQTLLMPRTAVTFEMLAALPREELLRRDAAVLGTLSDIALDYLCEKNNTKYFTVGELLSQKQKLRSWHGSTLNTASTFALLKRLGFSAKDGPFMISENDRHEALIQDLVSTEGLTLEEAKKFADIAARRNWV